MLQKLLEQLRGPADVQLTGLACCCELPWQALCDSRFECVELASIDFLSAVAEVTAQGSYAVVGVCARARLIYIEPVARIIFG